jgi:hypothetical protein
MKGSIEDGTFDENIFGDVKVTLSKNDGKLSLNIETLDDEEDSESIIDSYKELIENLDDDVFVEMTEILGKTIDLKKFDTLLDKEELTESEDFEINLYISMSLDVINKVISDRIEQYTDILDKIELEF